MVRGERRRVCRVPIVEGLESRALLNAAAPRAAEIHALASAAVVKGTIRLQITSQTQSPTDPSTRLVMYTGQGSASQIGPITVTGQHTITSLKSKKFSIDTYKGGLATLSAADGSLQAVYTGSGRTQAKGQITATLIGTGTGLSRLALGQSGSFVGHVTGNARSGSLKITFTIRV